MGFKYVLIPASADHPMQELEYGEAIDDLSKDTFREFIEKYFCSMGQQVDRSVLLEQLKERTGVDLQAKAKSGEMQDEAINRLLQSTSVEIFPVMLPTKDTGFEGISAYCDDKGIAKNLEENRRASGLVQACGYPGQTFRGDIFLGRIFDDNEEQWRRDDITLKDCSTDAAWVAVTKKQRSKRSSPGDMASFASKVGAKNPVSVNTAAMDVDAPYGECEKYSWRQTSDDVEITFKTTTLQKSDGKLVQVNFSKQKLKVSVKAEVLLDATLWGQTVPDDCTWTLSDGVVQVTLAKASATNWSALEQE